MNNRMGQQFSFYVPPITKVNKIFLISIVTVFLVESILLKFLNGNTVLAYLGLSYFGIISGFVYQVVTYPFAGGDFFSVLFNGLIIWFIGSDLERSLGTKRYLLLLIGSTLFTAFTYLALMLFIQNPLSKMIPLSGLTSICYALLICYAIIYSDRILQFMLIFPMKAKYFCILLISIEVYMGIFSSQGSLSLAHLASMFFAYVYLVALTQKSLFLAGLSTRFFSLFNKSSSKKRGHLSLVQDDLKEDLPLDREKNDEKHYWH